MLIKLYLGPIKRNPGGNDLEKVLKFSPEQTEKFRELREEHHTQMRMNNDSIRLLKDELFAGLSENISVVEKKLVLHEIGKLVASTDSLTYSHFRKVRELCTPEQQKLFDKVIKEILRDGPPPARGESGPPPQGGLMSPPPYGR